MKAVLLFVLIVLGFSMIGVVIGKMNGEDEDGKAD